MEPKKNVVFFILNQLAQDCRWEDWGKGYKFGAENVQKKKKQQPAQETVEYGAAKIERGRA